MKNHYAPLLLATTLAIFSAAVLSSCRGPGNSYEKTMLVVPSAPGSAEVHLAAGTDGTVVLSWLEPSGDNTALRFATLLAAGWSAPSTVAAGDDWFVSWADFPSVVPVKGKLWGAQWLVRHAGSSYAYDVAVAVSGDAGKHWSKAVTPHQDGVAAEHGFASLFSSGDAVGVVWLDGRESADDGDASHDPATASTMLRWAAVASDGSLQADQLIDARVCDCCRTDVAMLTTGPLIAYRDRSSEEIRDIAVTSAVDGIWQAPRRVANDNWKIEGCPVNGPTIAADARQLAVAWYTAANDDSRVQLARSTDNGKTFQTAIVVDSDKPLGHTGIALLDDGSAVVSWLRVGEEHKGEICIRRVSADGAPGTVHVVATTDASPDAGFPQLVRAGADLIVAWTDMSGDETQIATARIRLETL